MMPAEHPELTEFTLQGVKTFAAHGARDVLILVSTASVGDDVVARKDGELTQQDKQRLTSEGIPEGCWEDDAMIVEKRYLNDSTHKSVNVENCHQMKKQYVLEKITSLLNNTTMPTVILHYIGPGRRATGDWCFCDGYISFRDIADLYTQHFTGRVLSIISDCSYSGKWVESCKEFLDEVGVQPCGHSAQKKGIKLKVWCSCQPDQIGSSLIYSARGIGNDKNTGACYIYVNRSIISDQATCGDDFTRITCGKTPEEECALVPTFTYKLKKTLSSRLFRVMGEVRGRPAWHIALLVDDPETIRILKEKTHGENAGTQTTNINDYGKSIKSGWGQEPPQEVEDWMDRVQDGLETLSL